MRFAVDIDLLVRLKPPGERPVLGLKWFGLEEKLGELLGRNVDLVSEDALSPYLRPHVERQMVVLYNEETVGPYCWIKEPYRSRVLWR